MNFSKPRTILIGVIGVTIVAAIFFLAPLLSPHRGASRAVHGALNAFEAGDFEKISELISENYSGPPNTPADFSHDEVCEMARLLRGMLSVCTVSRTNFSCTLNDEETGAIVKADLRLRATARGGFRDFPDVEMAPVSFTLTRPSKKPWVWKITRIETPRDSQARQIKTKLEEATQYF